MDLTNQAGTEPNQAFLDQCVDYLWTQFPTRGEKGAILLPTRRSTEVIRQKLELKGDCAHWYIRSLEDFVEETCPWEKSIPIRMLLELYDLFREVEPQTKLEKFTGWGYILLRDFDLIDRNMVDAAKLFANLADLKNLDRWNVRIEEPSMQMREYFRLWQNLHTVYQGFQERLKSLGQAYSGMMYRYLAENGEALLVNHPEIRHYVFIGFNALSVAEEEIFKLLSQHGKAEIIWDGDEYYLDPQSENKAGYFLRNYLQTWDRTNWRFKSNHLLGDAKAMQSLEVSNASMQGPVVRQLLQAHPEIRTAVVLPEEHLLKSILPELDAAGLDYNLTLGLPLKDSPIYNLLDSLFEMNQTSLRDKETGDKRFSHRSILRILNHPFVRKFEKKVLRDHDFEESPDPESPGLIFRLIQFINRHNWIYLASQDLLTLSEEEAFIVAYADKPELLEHCQAVNKLLRPLFEVVFKPWGSTSEIIALLEALVQILQDLDMEAERQNLKEFDKILKQMRGYLGKSSNKVNTQAFKIFLYQSFWETRVDFDQNKEAAIQITGLNETRNLDFERVIFCSVNENVLPRGKKVRSFIPLDVSQAYKLPSYQEQDAVVSYHFYRLLQRATQISYIHVSPSDTYGGSEKSRFLRQLEYDLVQANPKIQFQAHNVRFPSAPSLAKQDLIIPKDAQAQAQMLRKFAEGLSPSLINNFIRCSLRFYFDYLAGYREATRVEEKMSHSQVGSLIHEILEDIFKEMSSPNPRLRSDQIRAQIGSVKQRVEQKFQDDAYARYEITGENYLSKQVIAQQIERFLGQQAEEVEASGGTLEILTLENQELAETGESTLSGSLQASISYSLDGKAYPINLLGTTDRVDRLHEQIRIVDYKSGKYQEKDLKIKAGEEERLYTDPDADKIRQLWLYRFMLVQNPEQNLKGRREPGQMIRAGIYFLRKPEAGFSEIQAGSRGKDFFPAEEKEFQEVSMKHVQIILDQMLDPSQAFARTEEERFCQFCSYKEICGR